MISIHHLHFGPAFIKSSPTTHCEESTAFERLTETGERLPWLDLKGFHGMPRNPSLSKTGSKKHRAAGLETLTRLFFFSPDLGSACCYFVVFFAKFFTRR